MSYINVDVMRKQIEVMYSDLNKLRNQIDQMKKRENEGALGRLTAVGVKIRKSAGGISTKELMDYVRG